MLSPELDLLLEWNGTLYPIEVKANSTPARGAADGARAFREHHPAERVAPTLVLAPCDRAWPIAQDAWVLPWDSVPGV